MVSLPVASYNGMTRIQLRIFLYRRQQGRCAGCDQPFFITRRPSRLTEKLRTKLATHNYNIDHTWPQSHGGPSELWNVTLMHWECNQEKADRCDYERCVRCGRVPDPRRARDVDQVPPGGLGSLPWPRSEPGREPVSE